jgi:hypothetical protein
MAKKQTVVKVAVSKRALFQRINRRLKRDGEELRASRTEKQAEELGDYFTVQVGAGQPQKYLSNGVCVVHVKLEKFGRELGVLQPWEQMEG